MNEYVVTSYYVPWQQSKTLKISTAVQKSHTHSAQKRNQTYRQVKLPTMQHDTYSFFASSGISASEK